MEKTEERKPFIEKVNDWVSNHKKKIRLSAIVIYIISVTIGAIIDINLNGGIQEPLDYPEQQYQQLEQELKNIIVEGDGIYTEELSNDSIKYDISYKEQPDSEGKYTITLTDDVTISGTIGKKLKKEDLIIEREYKTESEYRIKTIGKIVLFLILGLVYIYSLFSCDI